MFSLILNKAKIIFYSCAVTITNTYFIGSRDINCSLPDKIGAKKCSGETGLESHRSSMIIKVATLSF